MADDQENPPELPDIGFTPRMREYFNKLIPWLKRHRPVGATPLADAPGGGKLIPTLDALVDAKALPFTISAADAGGVAKVRISSSTLAGQVPDTLLLPVSNNYKIFGKVVWDTDGPTGGSVTTCTFMAAASVPDDDPEEATFYFLIGETKVTAGVSAPKNYRYGPIPSQLERVWFVWPKAFACTNQ